MRRAISKAGAAALVIAILVPAQILAAEASKLPKRFSDKSTRTIELRPGGVLWIDNAIGSIVITGGGDKVVVETTRVLSAIDDVTLEKLKKNAKVIVEGAADSQIVKSTGLVSSVRAVARIDYVVKVPAATALNVLSGVAELVRVSGTSGKLYVRNWRGKVEIVNSTGPVQVDTVNTNVLASFSQRPVSTGQFSSVNGNVEIRVPKSSRFEWYAETMKGDILAAFPAKGRVTDRSGQQLFHASVNGGGGAALRSTSVTGNIYLVPMENVKALAASVLQQGTQQGPVQGVVVEKEDVNRVFRSVVATLLVEAPSSRSFDVRKARVAGNYDFTAELGENVFVGQVEGFARINAAGGEVVLGRVAGDCRVASQGGPVNLGEIAGVTDVRTYAGDIKIGRASKGGQLVTGGGSVDVRSTGGPLAVESAGGNLFIEESSSRVAAATRSGDILVRLDGKGVKESSDLRTGQGNVTLEIPKDANVTIDATIMMLADASHRFESDFPGLTVVRERVGNGMRIRATGKVNGGGPLMMIFVSNGNISLRRSPDGAVSSMRR